MALAGLLIAGCNVPRVAGLKVGLLRRWYVPSVENTTTENVPFESVAFLGRPPEDRTYKVIGYFCPPAREYKSMAELLNAARAAGSLYGADAVYVEQQTSTEGWSFSANQWGAGGGSYKDVNVRVAVIVYE